MPQVLSSERRCYPVAMVAAVLLLLMSISGAIGGVSPTTPLPPRFQLMQIRLVRDSRPGCAPNCAEWIAMEGRIELGTAGFFERVLRRMGKHHPPVFIDSPGGSINDALAIGGLIRAGHLDVVVAQTAFDGCEPNARCPLSPFPSRPRPLVYPARVRGPLAPFARQPAS